MERFPHMRGDGPSDNVRRFANKKFSPHAWGWSAEGAAVWDALGVFPTCVGMVRFTEGEKDYDSGFPHMRGDGPRAAKQWDMPTEFSPHAWGWSATL